MRAIAGGAQTVTPFGDSPATYPVSWLGPAFLLFCPLLTLADISNISDSPAWGTGEEAGTLTAPNLAGQHTIRRLKGRAR